jgi:hypothetical protein
MGPDRTSCRERRLLPGVAALRPFVPAFFDADFLEGFFFETFLFDVLAGDLAAAAFFLREGFFAPAFAVFFLLGRLRATDFFAAFFLLLAFLVAFFFAGLRAAGLRRAAAFFFDTFLLGDCFLVLLTLRFLPEAFLRTPGFRDDAGVLLAPARFRFLLAAFLAGMVHSRVREKREIIHRLPQHGSPKSARIGGVGAGPRRAPRTCRRRLRRAVKRPMGGTKVQRAMQPPVRRSRDAGQANLRLSG